MSKSSNSDKKIMQHTFEVRLKNRLFSFLDIKGELIDFMLQEPDLDLVRVSNQGTQIEIASNDLSKLYFFSHEHFGCQLEGSEKFSDLSNEGNKVLDALARFNKYKANNTVRIGTKTTIFHHRRGDNLENLKRAYKSLMFSGYNHIEQITGGEVYDVGLGYFDMKHGGGIGSIMTGPVAKEEAITKFFGDHDVYRKFDRSNGLLFQVDYGQHKNISIEDIKKDLSPLLVEGVTNAEEIFKGFLQYFNEESRYE